MNILGWFGRKRYEETSSDAKAVNVWPFDQAPNVAALTTRQVLEDKSSILFVTHYADDDSWAFTCGTTNASEDARLVSMAKVVELDPSIIAICQLPPGWEASRSAVGAQWVQHQSL